MKLVFLENDYECPASDESIEYGKQGLCNFFNLPEDVVDNMEIVYQFGLLSNEEAYAKVFAEDQVIVTHSMYVKGSDTDFLYFLEAAARNEVSGLTYICTSGCIVEFLRRDLREQKNAFAIACAINTNDILSVDMTMPLETVYKVTIKPGMLRGDHLELTKIDTSILANKITAQ